MRVSISLRLTIALSLAALVLFGGVGAWQVAAEEADLRRAVEHDMALLGRSLQVSFENALRDRQEEDLQETLRELERIDPSVDVFVYDASGARIAASSGVVARARWLAVRPERAELRFVDSPEPGLVELLMPLRITREGRPATLGIVRPLGDMHADLAATRVRVGLSVAAFVLIVGLLTMALSRFWVGRPLAAMVAHMQRVRGGDLSSAPLPDRNDEVGQTLHEFEVLVRDLRDTRARVDAEAEARQRLEGQLRDLDKMRAVGELAAGLAHEIGSPLQILDGRLAALVGKADDAVETRRVSFILREQVQRITRIVARLARVARRPTRMNKAFDARSPVRTVVELIEGEARRRGVAVTLLTADVLPTINGDPDAIQQVLLNLIGNALDATPRGGRVEVELTSATTLRAREALRIVVRDDGRGMDEATRNRAFEPFFTTRDEHGGTGLGLAVVRGIVDEIGAGIALESEIGRGTTVTVDIPSAEGGTEAAHDAA